MRLEGLMSLPQIFEGNWAEIQGRRGEASLQESGTLGSAQPQAGGVLAGGLGGSSEDEARWRAEPRLQPCSGSTRRCKVSLAVLRGLGRVVLGSS